jgi:hydrogenase maturation protein HypF
VWRLAQSVGLRGWVCNDGQGVTLLACGPAAARDAFVAALPGQAPPLARIEAIVREATTLRPEQDDFCIVASHAGSVHTGIVPDAATCPACLAEIFDPLARRFRYPFTNCTHCGPRLSIIDAIPYDRATTTMRTFPLCPQCAAEYADPADRRFHAQPVACPACGPHVWLEQADGSRVELAALNALDALDAACTLLLQGHIVAIKGLGGFQLACDAGDEAAVARLRQRKRRERKPLALMARDLDVVRRYCRVGAEAAALLQSPAAPIVILDICDISNISNISNISDSNDTARVAASVAPGMTSLGFMLPNTPLHHLLMQRMERPMVLTSGNLSDEPQCIDNADARERLCGIADYFLMHDRGIARRVDDSVVRVMAGAPRLMRRARGYAPAPIRLAEGFVAAPPVLAMGGELKNSFCLLRDGQAILSHHIGDLEDARCHADYLQSIKSYQQLFQHGARIIAVDQHPEYLSGKLGRQMAGQQALVCEEVQHHHAHIAACMAENGIDLDNGPVIGVALDGLGYGADGTLWGGEFLLADYRQCQRLGSFLPVALLGGEQAVYEPWRNTYAHLMAAMGWASFASNYQKLDLYHFLDGKPRAMLDGMMAKGVNSPLASSCGRLFDAVAAAAGICCERVNYEGQAAVEFEALVDQRALQDEDNALAYPFAIEHRPASAPAYIEPRPMWQALLDDLQQGTPTGLIAARFHKGLARVIVRMIEVLSQPENGRPAVNTVALSGGVFQNRILLEQVVMRLENSGFRVLTHRQVAANDGGLALGQAVVAAARAIAS